MRNAVEKAGLKCHYMCQPLGYRTADAGRLGFIELPECPFGKFLQGCIYKGSKISIEEQFFHIMSKAVTKVALLSKFCYPLDPPLLSKYYSCSIRFLMI